MTSSNDSAISRMRLRGTTLAQQNKTIARAPPKTQPKTKRHTPAQSSRTKLTIQVPPRIAFANTPTALSTEEIVSNSLPAPSDDFVQGMSRSAPRDRDVHKEVAFSAQSPMTPFEPEDPDCVEKMHQQLIQGRDTLDKCIDRLYKDMQAACAQATLAQVQLDVERVEFGNLLSEVELIAGYEVKRDLLRKADEERRERSGVIDWESTDDREPARNASEEINDEDDSSRVDRMRNKGKGRDRREQYAIQGAETSEGDDGGQNARVARNKGKGRAMDRGHGSAHTESEAGPSRRRKRGREVEVYNSSIQDHEESEQPRKRRRDNRNEQFETFSRHNEPEVAANRLPSVEPIISGTRRPKPLRRDNGRVYRDINGQAQAVYRNPDGTQHTTVDQSYQREVEIANNSPEEIFIGQRLKDLSRALDLGARARAVLGPGRH